MQEITIEEAWKLYEEGHNYSWTNPDLPKEHFNVNKKEWDKLDKDDNSYLSVPPFLATYEIMRDVLAKNPEYNILDVAAGNALYNKIFKKIGHTGKYTAVDYNNKFKEIALLLQKDIDYRIDNAAHLTSFLDESFDIVFSGCHLIHMMDWKDSLYNLFRVANKHVVLHRTPLYTMSPTRYYTKMAYNVPCIEIHFGSMEFFKYVEQICKLFGFEYVRSVPVFKDEDYGHWTILYTRQ